MYRTLVTSLVLLAMSQGPLVAQACMGFASYTAGPMQATATGGFNHVTTSLGAGVGYGIPSSVFGTLGIATTSYEPDDGSALGLAARAGYQFNLRTVRPIQVCPVAGFGYGMGPSDEVAGFSRSSRAASVGVHAGIEMTANARMTVVPTLGLSYAIGKDMAKDNGGATLYEISSSYGVAQLGVGIILNQNITVRPSVDIPLGREGSNPTVGVSLGINFGTLRVARPAR